MPVLRTKTTRFAGVNLGIVRSDSPFVANGLGHPGDRPRGHPGDSPKVAEVKASMTASVSRQPRGLTSPSSEPIEPTDVVTEEALPRAAGTDAKLRIIDLRGPGASALPLQPSVADDIVEQPARGDLGELIAVELSGAKTWQLVLKRIIDIIGSSVALIVLSPVLVLAAIAVLADSPGPIFFVQERIGRDGRGFRMYKFRSMGKDADEVRYRHERANECSGPIFKIRRDPRITPVGRVLRKLSIDELPQLINVLRGEMSLVGPRPPLPGEFRRYQAREMQRLLVTPGMTCIWQVRGRSEIDFDEWVELDLEYIRTWSLRLDLKLLFLTIPAVISGRGAY
jgi:lipopolysaccharide/colanic/teichoic acid biosynthesis glycosyltransferase